MDLDGCLEKLEIEVIFTVWLFRVWMCLWRVGDEFSALEMHLKRDYSKFWENVTDWEQFIFSFIWSKWMRNVKWRRRKWICVYIRWLRCINKRERYFTYEIKLDFVKFPFYLPERLINDKTWDKKYKNNTRMNDAINTF